MPSPFSSLPYRAAICQPAILFRVWSPESFSLFLVLNRRALIGVSCHLPFDVASVPRNNLKSPAAPDWINSARRLFPRNAADALPLASPSGRRRCRFSFSFCAGSLGVDTVTNRPQIERKSGSRVKGQAGAKAPCGPSKEKKTSANRVRASSRNFAQGSFSKKTCSEAKR